MEWVTHFVLNIYDKRCFSNIYITIFLLECFEWLHLISAPRSSMILPFKLPGIHFVKNKDKFSDLKIYILFRSLVMILVRSLLGNRSIKYFTNLICHFLSWSWTCLTLNMKLCLLVLIYVALSVLGYRARSHLFTGQNVTSVEMCGVICFWECRSSAETSAVCRTCQMHFVVSVAGNSNMQLWAEVNCEHWYITLDTLCHWHALLHGVKFSFVRFPVFFKYTLDWTSCGNNEKVNLFCSVESSSIQAN